MRWRLWRRGLIRFGIGWRNEISLQILANIDRLQILEIIIDDYLDCSKSDIEKIKFLEKQIPLTFHGIRLGLASSLEVETELLKKFYRFLKHFPNATWSEHIAFVRGRGVEIHHLAMPPLNSETLKGLKRNLEKTFQIIGSYPLMENPASLLFPPNSEWTEIEWIKKILEETPVNLLLDLHNLYSNSVNFGFDAYEYIEAILPERISAIHLAGGKRVGKAHEKILDTHLHSVPEEVFELLKFTLNRKQQNLDIVLERDGNYPPISELLDEIEKARFYVRN